MLEVLQGILTQAIRWKLQQGLHRHKIDYSRVDEKSRCARRNRRICLILNDCAGRGGQIRTDDPLLPKQMRYQAALRPDWINLKAASVSDAEEQLLHERHYMSHRMQAIFATKFAGTALTVLLKKGGEQRSESAGWDAGGDR
jgi:hypothetical protein